jgi:hypothetical protein
MRLGNLVTLTAGYEITVNHNLHYVLLHSVKVEERLRYMINLKAEISVHNKMVQCNRDLLLPFAFRINKSWRSEVTTNWRRQLIADNM